MAGRRPCGEHDVPMLADILQFHIVKWDFESYGQEMDKSPINPVGLLPHKRLLVKLFRTTQDCGVIGATDMKRALHIAVE